MTGNDLDTVLRLTAQRFVTDNIEIVDGKPRARLKVVFRKDWNIDHGETRDNMYEQVCYIGVKELEEAGDAEVSDKTVARAFLTLMHEVCGHSWQVNKEFKKDVPLSTVLALNHHACRHSDKYYGFLPDGSPTDVYYMQPHEIAAQYMGIKCAYFFLYGFWEDRERAQEAIKSVHDELVEKDSSYVIKPLFNRVKDGVGKIFGTGPSAGNDGSAVDAVTDRNQADGTAGVGPAQAEGDPGVGPKPVKHRDYVSRILQELDDSFQKSVHMNRPYEKDENNPDIVHDYVAVHPEKAYIYTRLEWCRDGLLTDWIMASLRSELVDMNGEMWNQAALSGVPLNAEKAMCYIPPETIRAINSQGLTLRDLSGHETMRRRGHEILLDYEESKGPPGGPSGPGE